MPIRTRLRRYSAQPHIHVTRSPYAVVLSSVSFSQIAKIRLDNVPMAIHMTSPCMAIHGHTYSWPYTRPCMAIYPPCQSALQTNASQDFSSRRIILTRQAFSMAPRTSILEALELKTWSDFFRSQGAVSGGHIPSLDLFMIVWIFLQSREPWILRYPEFRGGFVYDCFGALRNNF